MYTSIKERTRRTEVTILILQGMYCGINLFNYLTLHVYFSN